MKKILYTMLIIFIYINPIYAKSIDVTFSSCVDGDTAKFFYDETIITARFLAIDTPETKHPKKGIEAYGKEASNYTCLNLKKAKKIELVFDDNSDIKDKYGRYLAWVFIDNSLLQKELVANGLASVAYLYGDYKYTEELKTIEKIAKKIKQVYGL